MPNHEHIEEEPSDNRTDDYQRHDGGTSGPPSDARSGSISAQTSTHLAAGEDRARSQEKHGQSDGGSHDGEW